MVRTREALNRWTVALLFASILLPSVIFVALQFGFGYRAERQALETAMLAKSDAIMAEIDGNMQRTRASALALASAASVRKADWHGAHDRARELMAFNYDWASVRMIDVRSGEEVFDATRPFGTRRPFAEPPTLIRRLRSEKLIFEGIRRDGRGCPCIFVDAPVMRDGALRYIVVIVLDPEAFQKELTAHAPSEGSSAVLDATGKFIARTMDYPARVGTPATHYAQDALRSGRPRGIYRGVTYEGLANYTAFSVSPVTGWSTHVAIPKARFDTPRWWSHFASTAALVVSLILAISLVWGLMRVMAARRATDARMQEIQRLEAVGMMTGGIAHDFNNMLAVIIGSLELARRQRLSGRDVQQHLENAMSGASRAAELTRRLLAFSRQQTLEPTGLELNALLRDMEPLLSRSLNEQVELSYELAEPLWPIFIDKGQLENGVVNLAVNARDAMPSGGRVVIATADVALSAAHAALIGLPAGDYVRLTVTDSGEGMSEQTIKRVFEPFFTTKEVGRGTGLGLSQIYGFIEQSRGRIRIRSELGIGTTVEIFLPRFDGVVADTAHEDAVPGQMPSGRATETILVVEDEGAVRLAHVEALRELGYSVFHASNATAALEVLAAQPTIGLLFTDIVMPGMNGRDLARAARARDPDLKVLFTTGWERGAPVWETDAPDPREMLTKPFTMEQLARRVREALDR